MDLYDRDGQPLTMAQWSEKLGDPDYQRVASTDVGPYWVSTVWLGLDHNWQEGPPLIFETMVFSVDQRDDESERGLTDMECRRYGTETEALQGHEEMCTLIRATMITEDEILGHDREEQND